MRTGEMGRVLTGYLSWIDEKNLKRCGNGKYRKFTSWAEIWENKPGEWFGRIRTRLEYDPSSVYGPESIEYDSVDLVRGKSKRKVVEMLLREATGGMTPEEASLFVDCSGM